MMTSQSYDWWEPWTDRWRHMGVKHGQWRNKKKDAFRLLRTSASESCWEYRGRSWWPQHKFTRWLE